MKILVTGAAGFVGSHVVDLLIKEGHTPWCIDDLSSGHRSNIKHKVEFAEVNVGDWWSLMAEFTDCEPEAVIHLAAQPSICESIDNPIKDAYSNVMGTLNVIRASQKIGVKRLVFSSTSAVYRDLNVAYFSEENPCYPNSPYGISKLAAESYVRLLMPDNGTVLRFANVYGERQVPLGENQVIPKMIQHFEKGDPFFIHGNGEQQRDFIHVADVARACLMALEGDADIYNISSAKAVSVNLIAKMLAEIYEVPEYPWEHDDQTDPRKRVEMSNYKAREEIGWKPEVELEDGLKRTVKWWKEQ